MAVNTRRHRLIRRKRGRMRRLFLSLLLITALFFFFHSGIFALQTVEVKGNRRVTKEEVLQLAAVERGLNLWQVDIRGIVTRLQTHPLIDQVFVARRWPHTLVITVREREAMALLPADEGFFVIDGEGYIMERVSNISQLELPLISGIKLDRNTGPGSQLTGAGLESALAVLNQLPLDARQQIAEIEAREPDNLLLYLPGRIKVKFGDSNDAQGKWKRLQEALQGISKIGGLEYIDVSFTGPPAIKFRQER